MGHTSKTSTTLPKMSHVTSVFSVIVGSVKGVHVLCGLKPGAPSYRISTFSTSVLITPVCHHWETE